jgi:hypothetical protein
MIIKTKILIYREKLSTIAYLSRILGRKIHRHINTEIKNIEEIVKGEKNFSSYVILPNLPSIAKIINFPIMKYKEIKKIYKNEIDEELLKEATSEIAEIYKDKEKDEYHLLLEIHKKANISKLTKELTTIGINIKGFISYPFSLYLGIRKKIEGSFFALSIEDKKSILLIGDKEKLLYIRNIPYGFYHIDKEIENIVNNKTYHQRTTIKKIILEDTPENIKEKLSNEIDTEKLLDIKEKFFEKLYNEILFSLTHFYSRYSKQHKKIDYGIICKRIS